MIAGFPSLPTIDPAAAEVVAASAKLSDAARQEHAVRFATQLEAAFRQRADALSRYRPSLPPATDGEPLGQLFAHGIAAFRLSDRTFRRLAGAFAPHVASIRAHQATKPVRKWKFADNCFPIRAGGFADEFAAVDDVVGELGLPEILQAYTGASLRPRLLNVQLTTAEWIAGHYGAIDGTGLPACRSAYFHVDSEVWPHVKLLIYLTRQVDLDRGPFRYVRGSHNWCTPLELLIRQTNDSLKASRDLYLSLPEAFRMHALFGDDMRPDDPGLAALLEREWAVTSADGDVILFDTNGVHRGGFVRSGERIILQVLLGPGG